MPASDITSIDNIADAVSEDMARALCAELGYKDWSEARIKRVAAEARFAMGETMCGAAFAFSHAVEMELMMFGDGSMNNLVGILP